MSTVKTKRKSLSEFSPSGRTSGKCWICSIPERDEIDEAKRTGAHTSGQIIDWLVEECGYPADVARKARLQYHYEARHHIAAVKGKK